MVSILDCTLRDGGYCNQWNFGKNNIVRIIQSLCDAGVDIVECGFLSFKASASEGITRRPKLENFLSTLPHKRKSTLFVCMINSGEFVASELPKKMDCMMDGIRVAFHKNDMKNAIQFCHDVKEKGYKVFVQPMVTLAYSDSELLDLICLVNELNPFAFYIVDSFGDMKRRDLVRLFSIIEHNLGTSISIGYHAHNNMQMAYSNAQALLDIHSSRNVIIDASILGMGRGAGNLNTELLVEYLNDSREMSYLLKPILVIMDDIINFFYQKKPWGYSVPNYLSAKHHIHPNYANYLDSKKTLTMEAMDEIFNDLTDAKKNKFDSSYIESLYQCYMNGVEKVSISQSNYEEIFYDKRILLIGPGKSSKEEASKIITFALESDVVPISVNFFFDKVDTKYLFVSNQRRFRALESCLWSKCIVTSNIRAQDVFLRVDYTSLLNDDSFVRDNAGLMAIHMMINCHAKEVILAGFDGYSHDACGNYGDENMTLFMQEALYDAINASFSRVLKKYSSRVSIAFLTKQKYIRL